MNTAHAKRFPANPEGFRQPEILETLSSYLAAWRGHFHVSAERFAQSIYETDPTLWAAIQRDPDFPDHPSCYALLSSVTHIWHNIFVRHISKPVSPFPLLPAARRVVCLECLSAAPAIGDQVVFANWIDSLTTVCPWHGFPYIEFPAIGHGIVDLPWGQRRQVMRMLHDLDAIKDSVGRGWERVPEDLRNAFFFAEVAAHMTFQINPVMRLSQSHAPPNATQVWRDLLTVLSRCWSCDSLPILAASGFPWLCKDQRRIIGGSSAAIDYVEPTFDMFRSTTDPAVRRACIFVAWTAIDPQAVQSVAPLSFRFSGWQFAVKEFPDHAWAFLVKCSQSWPPRWRDSMRLWSEQRGTKVRARRRHDAFAPTPP